MEKIKYLSKFCLILTVMFFIVKSGYAADRVYIRVTLNDSKPKLPAYVGLIIYGSHNFKCIKKMAFGRESQEVSFGTDFHNVLDFGKLKNVSPLIPGKPSTWHDITDIIYLKNEYRNSVWRRFSNSYMQKTLIFSFFAPSLSEKLPKGKAIELGNLQSVNASIDFATKPSENSIVKTVTYASENSCVPIYIRKPGNHLAAYADQIRTLYDYADDRLRAIRKRGVTKQPLPQKIITSTRVQNGYFYPVYDRKTMEKEVEILRILGIKSILWNYRKIPGIDINSFPEHNLYWEKGHPEWINPNPWIDNFMKLAIKQIAPAIQDDIEQWKVGEKDKVLYKIGDEWRLIKTSTIIKQKGGLEAFRTWLKTRGIKSAEIGTGLDAALPIDKKDVKDEKTAYLYYLTALFRQETTIEWWKKLADAMRQVSNGRILITSETFFGPFDSTPNFFLLSESGVTDIDAHEYAQRLWGPSHGAILKANIYRSAAKLGKSKPGILWALRGLERGGSVRIVELDGITALINKIQHFYLYGYGPLFSGWGGMDDFETPDIYAAVAKIMQLIPKVESVILNGRSSRYTPKVAMLLSQSSELWAGGAENGSPSKGWLCERQMLAASMAWNQIPFDILPEHRIKDQLNNYKVLYITDPNLLHDAQETIASWVKEGGILFTIAGAAMFNEKNQPENLLDKLTNELTIKTDNTKKLALYRETSNLYKTPVFGKGKWLAGKEAFDFEVAARKEVISLKGARVLAKYDGDNKTAAILFKTGKGKVIRVGTSLGTVLARSMKPRFHHVVIEDQRKYDNNVSSIYQYPYQIAGLKRKLSIDKPGVESAFFETKNEAIILMADYESQELDKVTVKARFERNYKTCSTEDGDELPLKIIDGITIIEDVPLETSQVLFLKKRSQ